jgi:hypothetical protein
MTHTHAGRARVAFGAVTSNRAQPIGSSYRGVSSRMTASQYGMVTFPTFEAHASVAPNQITEPSNKRMSLALRHRPWAVGRSAASRHR